MTSPPESMYRMAVSVTGPWLGGQILSDARSADGWPPPRFRGEVTRGGNGLTVDRWAT